jgi:hypothetical protein
MAIDAAIRHAQIDSRGELGARILVTLCTLLGCASNKRLTNNRNGFTKYYTKDLP